MGHIWSQGWSRKGWQRCERGNDQQHRNLHTNKFKFQVQVTSGAFFQESNVLTERIAVIIVQYILNRSAQSCRHSLLIVASWDLANSTSKIHKSAPSMISNKALRNKRPSNYPPTLMSLLAPLVICKRTFSKTPPNSCIKCLHKKHDQSRSNVKICQLTQHKSHRIRCKNGSVNTGLINPPN